MRMFVALVPPESTLEHLEEFLDPRRDAAAFRWTAPEQVHVTLAFAEDVPERSLDDLGDRLERAAAKRTAFDTRITGGGAFPNAARARVLWAALVLTEDSRTEVDRLETDPERAAALGRAMRKAVAHPTVAAWLGDVWARLRSALAADAANPEGRTVALLEGAFSNAGTLLAEDPAARERLTLAVQRVLVRLMPAARAQLADFIAKVVAGWDTAQVTEKIELRVGRDLQYVRMNGTLVGFLVGGALFALLTAIFGRVAY